MSSNRNTTAAAAEDMQKRLKEEGRKIRYRVAEQLDKDERFVRSILRAWGF